MEQPTRFVGMDVHKDTIVVAVTAAGDVGKATFYGTIPNTTAALEKLVTRLRVAGSGPLKFCYETGPCGYGVHRTLTRLGEDCMVAAPSMIPRRSGDRQKNDKRDASALAVLHRGGLLTAVWVPDAAHGAMRDLIRARQAAMRAVRAARQQPSGFLLRHARTYPPAGAPGRRRIGAGLPIRASPSRRSRSYCRKALKRCASPNNVLIASMAIFVRGSPPGRWARWCKTCAPCVAWT